MKRTAAVIGLGFVGRAHVDALRRLAIPIRGALGSSTANESGQDELVLCEAIAKSAQNRAWASL